MKLKEVKSQLKPFTINYSGKGYIIKKVSPSPGTILPEGSTIKILLGDWQVIVKSKTF